MIHTSHRHTSGVNDHHRNLAAEVAKTGKVTCIICKADGATYEEMWEKCTHRQKQRVLGPNRQFSCEMCDVHLSEQEWLDNHNGGEKHRWCVDRVERGLPVQFEHVEPMVIQKQGYNPFSGMPEYWQEFRCLVCKVNFSPVEKYKKHVGSLFHLKKTAGEDVKWIDNGQNN